MGHFINSLLLCVFQIASISALNLAVNVNNKYKYKLNVSLMVNLISDFLKLEYREPASVQHSSAFPFKQGQGMVSKKYGNIINRKCGKRKCYYKWRWERKLKWKSLWPWRWKWQMPSRIDRHVRPRGHWSQAQSEWERPEFGERHGPVLLVQPTLLPS